eukprot:TRINITY_DN5524_c0_g1_i1.p1 TRINITY_DN5524_c0_g1~~TRINITY_DN5524_c0_g1_i1.p1  ORF type:complete len:108 (+),score=27.11 TRINITY_DN5524_c0_g1_i1:237-560(+)
MINKQPEIKYFPLLPPDDQLFASPIKRRKTDNTHTPSTINNTINRTSDEVLGKRVRRKLKRKHKNDQHIADTVRSSLFDSNGWGVDGSSGVATADVVSVSYASSVKR